MQRSITTAAFSLDANCSSRKPLDDSNSGFFEFKPHTQITSVPQSSSAGYQVLTYYVLKFVIKTFHLVSIARLEHVLTGIQSYMASCWKKKCSLYVHMAPQMTKPRDCFFFSSLSPVCVMMFIRIKSHI